MENGKWKMEVDFLNSPPSPLAGEGWGEGYVRNVKWKIICLLILHFTFYILHSALAEPLPAHALLDNKSISITRQTVKMRSMMDSKFNGFEYKIKNNTKEKIYINKFGVENGVPPYDAYGSVKRNGWAAAGVTFVYGWNYALPTLGLSMVAATAATPFFVTSSALGNIGATQEAKRFDVKSPEGKYIKPNETIKFKTIVEQGALPALTLIVEDPSTGDNFAYINSQFGSRFIPVEKPQPVVETQEQNSNPDTNIPEAAKQDEQSTSKIKQMKDGLTNEVKQRTKALDDMNIKDDDTADHPALTGISPQEGNKPTEMTVPDAYKMYNTGVTVDPNAKTKQYFNDSSNFTSF